MIEVRCGACDREFSVADDLAGQAETCPECGALNDVPDDRLVTALSVSEPNQMLMLIDAPAVRVVRRAKVQHRSKEKRGIPIALWWSAIVLVVAAFVAGIIYISGDDWEQKNLLGFVQLSVSADHLMDSGDFDGAAGKYEKILSDVGTRPLTNETLIELVKSVGLRLNKAKADADIVNRVKTADAMAAARQWDKAIFDYNDALNSAPQAANANDPMILVLQRARKGLASAQDPKAREADDPSIVLDPTAMPDVAGRSPTTQTDSELLAASAVNRFQRSGENFARDVSSKAFLFLDSNGKWRQRQYVVWEVNTVRGNEPGETHSQLKLTYSATSRTTGPHQQPQDATNDSNFNVAEPDVFIHHETNFALIDNKWVAKQRRRGDGDKWVDATDPQFAAKRADGSVERFLEQDLWQLEIQTMGN